MDWRSLRCHNRRPRSTTTETSPAPSGLPEAYDCRIYFLRSASHTERQVRDGHLKMVQFSSRDRFAIGLESKWGWPKLNLRIVKRLGVNFWYFLQWLMLVLVVLFYMRTNHEFVWHILIIVRAIVCVCIGIYAYIYTCMPAAGGVFNEIRPYPDILCARSPGKQNSPPLSGSFAQDAADRENWSHGRPWQDWV